MLRTFKAALDFLSAQLATAIVGARLSRIHCCTL
jgi:hypothetical protein